jgi:hypothetical protein
MQRPLPSGKGRAFLNQGCILDQVIGGWTLGALSTFDTGTAVAINRGTNATGVPNLSFGQTTGLDFP